MTYRERFEVFWGTPVQDGCSYAEVYGSLGRDVAMAAWQASRKQAIQDAYEAVEGHFIFADAESEGDSLLKKIVALANPEGKP